MRLYWIALLFTACETPEPAKTDTQQPGQVDTEEDPEDTQEPVDGPQDKDGDGFYDDCDDNNAAIYPGAAEICDGLDNDCNGLVDDDTVDDVEYFQDADADGYGDPTVSEWACEVPAGFVENDRDCDDANALFNPSAIEANCEDPTDYNCDGSVGYADEDGDGFAACAECDDTDAATHPDATETCNDVDDNCNGLTDDEDPLVPGGSTWYADADGDVYGGDQFTVAACDAPDGYVSNTDDCDDLAPASHPGASEICDDADNDCDGTVDEGVGHTWYADSDGDGYGDAATTSQECTAPPGYSANGDDCDDTDPSARPGGVEVCDAADNDCDGMVDGSDALDAQDWYADTDNDGFGDASNSAAACTAPSGHGSDDSDCDDANGAVHPGAAETCNSLDDNCDGTIDESTASDATTWYQDLDGDTYGDSATSQAACDAPLGFVADSTDCDDLNPSASPAGTEVCDSANVDEDCDGQSDDSDPEGASGKTTWYADADGDGYGDNGDPGTSYCDAPSSLVSTNTDCDDTASATYPGASETCDDVDSDCDGDLVDSGDDNCHALATCTDDGTGANYACDCDTGYTGDGISTCDIDTFPESTLLSAANKTQVNQWASSSGQVWTLCYRKSTDGNSSSTFHTGCDGYSNTISIAQLDTGKLIGGYADVSWSGSGYTGNSNNFLFSLTQNYRIMHCTGQHSCGHSQYNANNYGPTFGGGHDWHVNSNMTSGYCNLGHDYACQTSSYGNSACRNDFCGNYSSWTIQELEVWGR